MYRIKTQKAGKKMKTNFVNGSQGWPLRCTGENPVQIISGDARSKLLEFPDETTCDFASILGNERLWT